jgi:DNA-binding IscR family transcriptional regulator
VTRASQADLVLAAVLDGLNTSTDIADHLGISTDQAGKIIWQLRKQGYLRKTPRRIPSRSGHNGGGNPRVVYAAV